nr:MAG TPA: hypothetical protein [Bacteriophage sp.]
MKERQFLKCTHFRGLHRNLHISNSMFRLLRGRSHIKKIYI